MYAIIDKRSSQELKNNLSKYVDDVFEFSSKDITYNSISCHPDVFIFQDENQLIIAPNAPLGLVNFLNNKKVNYSFGVKPVGEHLDESVLYNSLVTKNYFFCKQGKPDVSIQNQTAAKQVINLPQSYTRCCMFNVDNNIITSDLGIVKVLESKKIEHFYFDPSQITIKEHKNGFIGGTAGVVEDSVFFLGNILKHKDGKALQQYITKQKKDVICLGNDFLYDGGAIFFVS
jgi:hypothetical protein